MQIETRKGFGEKFMLYLLVEIFRAISIWMCTIASGKLYFAMRLVQKTRATLFEPITFKTKLNCDLVICIFPRFQ